MWNKRRNNSSMGAVESADTEARTCSSRVTMYDCRGGFQVTLTVNTVSRMWDGSEFQPAGAVTEKAHAPRTEARASDKKGPVQWAQRVRAVFLIKSKKIQNRRLFCTERNVFKMARLRPTGSMAPCIAEPAGAVVLPQDGPQKRITFRIQVRMTADR